MRTFLRHLALCALPLVGGIAGGYGFSYVKQSCVALVGPLLAGKCHDVQRDYQLRFQLAGTAAGTLVASTIGAWLEWRRRRTLQKIPSQGAPS